MATNRKASTDERKSLAVRIAASGDLHCCAEREEEVRAVLADASADAEMLLLAGDLTSLGKPEEAALLARVCQALDIPTLAVLGNHDWHCARHDEVVAELAAGGITVLDGAAATLQVGGCSVGVVGTKGFVG